MSALSPTWTLGDGDMVWIAFAAMIVACVVATVSIATRRRAVDRDSVSAHWIAQHRLEP